MTSDADRLLSAGMPIQAAGGEVRLRFSMLVLKRCEDAYGNLAGTIDELRWLVEQKMLLFPEPVADRLLRMLRCASGLPLAGEFDTDSSPAWCIEALMEAWLEAFPAPDGVDEGKA